MHTGTPCIHLHLSEIVAQLWLRMKRAAGEASVGRVLHGCACPLRARCSLGQVKQLGNICKKCCVVRQTDPFARLAQTLIVVVDNSALQNDADAPKVFKALGYHPTNLLQVSARSAAGDPTVLQVQYTRGHRNAVALRCLTTLVPSCTL
jgi:hypothetical protein